MQISQFPEEFSPAFADIVYRFSLTESEQGTEIPIYDATGTEIIGIKKASSFPDFSMNVTDYVRAQIELKPFPVGSSGIRPQVGRIYESRIGVGLNADMIYTRHTAGTHPRAVNEIFSDNPFRSLAPDETDEISLIVERGEVTVRAVFHTVTGDTLEVLAAYEVIAEKSLITILVNGADLSEKIVYLGRIWQDFTGFDLKILQDQYVLQTIPYRVRPAVDDSLRVCWWNKYGAIDAFTFGSVFRQSESIERENTLNDPTRMPRKLSTRKSWKISTPYGTRSKAEWLLGLAASPRAWIIDGDQYLPVWVVTEKLCTRSDTDTGLIFEFIHCETTDYPSR